VKSGAHVDSRQTMLLLLVLLLLVLLQASRWQLQALLCP
jgi:hypothetical protein